MAFRCRRRRRSNSEPIPLPPPRRRPKTHTVIIPVKMPTYNNHEITEPRITNWARNYFDENRRLPSTFEIQREVEKWPESKDALWDATLSIAFDCTERVATQWIMGESIDASLKYRHPDPQPPFDENCIYSTNKNEICAICQNAEEGNRVALKACQCIYHEKCLRKACKYSMKCAVCGFDVREYEADGLEDDIVVEVIV